MSTDTTRPLGAQISQALKDRGVEVIFGIPGVHNVELYRGIEEAGLKHVLTRHEQGAGFMADGYARATGKPGIAYVITGPGLTNIMTALGQAYSDSVSVLAISSCLEREHRSMGRGRLHEMRDQEGAAATVTSWSKIAPDAKAAYSLIDKALAEWSTERPRSIHISVPIDVLGAPAAPAPAQAPVSAAPTAPAQTAAAVADMLRNAKRPLFVLGGGARHGAAALRALTERTGAVVFPTYAGKGIVPDGNGPSLGAFLGRPGSLEVIGVADLVIVFGSELSETDLWRDHLGNTAPMVRVDIDADVLTDDHAAQVPVKSDAPAFAAALLEALNDQTNRACWLSDVDLDGYRAAFRAAADAERPGIVPILDAVREALPTGGTVVSDMTQFAYVGKEVVHMEAPGLWHHPTGFGTLGYALPAAIGAKIGRGDEPVIAIAGDYGFHYTMQELGVAVELGLSLPILLWDNGKLKEIEDSMVASQIAPNAVVAHNPDFPLLAQAFGAKAEVPGDLDALKTAIGTALGADGPTLIYITPDIVG